MSVKFRPIVFFHCGLVTVNNRCSKNFGERLHRGAGGGLFMWEKLMTPASKEERSPLQQSS